VAYLAAALVGALVGLIAGKPIWAAGGRIEAGLKAGFGAILAIGLMWLTRSFLTVSVPFDLAALGAAPASGGTVGGLAITSLALVAAVLGAFYDADNTPEPVDPNAKPDAKAGADAPKARIGAKAAAAEDDELGLEEEVPPPKKQAKR
jgi:hypothetical protein